MEKSSCLGKAAGAPRGVGLHFLTVEVGIASQSGSRGRILALGQVYGKVTLGHVYGKVALGHVMVK